MLSFLSYGRVMSKEKHRDSAFPVIDTYQNTLKPKSNINGI